MKIQLAIDRVSIEKAKEISREASPYIDIIEVGTALIKDFGIVSIKEIKEAFPNKIILADMKTIDEGAYEFKAAFNSGADIATVMGAASVNTLEACYKVAQDFGKFMMIDLLEVGYEKINMLTSFSDAIFCIHSPSDGGEQDLTALLKEFKEKFPKISKVAVAGGINYQTITTIKEANVDIVIIGGAITKADNIGKAAKKFKEMI
ncbi:3-hexulose-6-phosphate synthase [Clostridium sp. CF012]|uniref:3-hexulose-6-phosphate synthase n=1 Tax=Clostridium sp. CF012 TaxID=2843319 RepID=UPI001C0D3611|nr:3-hexulose-6-phosphate synthase [Clostridium sp. CF012]MBU3142823.1 orotidine 5'-phosphate decarboxylase [Clostridium sp. CF012]